MVAICFKSISFFKVKPSFADLTGKECQRHSLDFDIDFEKELNFYDKFIPDGAKHGDMIIAGKKQLRSMEIYYVKSDIIEIPEADEMFTKGFRFKVVNRLCQEDESGSGYTNVPKEVTSRLKNPITFYENSFKFDDYAEIDFGGFKIDTEAHQDLIQTFTNGRPVSYDKECSFLLDGNEWGDKGKFSF